MKRKHFLHASLSCVALSLALGGAAWAQEYPSKPIKMIIPAAAGGGNDALGRVLAIHLEKQLGQPVVLDFHGGASGRIAGEMAATAPADGYTLLMTYAGLLTVNPVIFKNMKYDPVRDFAPVSAFVEVPNVLVVHPSVKVNSVAELISLAKSQPGKLNFASSGTGTSIYLAMELLRQRAGIEMTHVVYKGGAPAMADVMAGHVQMMFNNLVEVAPMARAGKVKALAIGSTKRSSLLPEVPTVQESGLPGYESTLWYGLVVPANTPPAIVNKLHAAVRRIQQQPEVIARLQTMGADVMDSSPAEFGARIKSDIALWGEVVRKAGIKPE